MRSSGPQIVLVRHGETEWSKNGKHTSFSDIPLTLEGERQAAALKGELSEWDFKLVMCSPRARAKRTCELAGFLDRAEITDDLAEWNYGDYEGITTKEIRQKDPKWTVFTSSTPGGETPDQVAERCDRVIERAKAINDDVVLFAHSHVLRVLIARWLELPPIEGRHFVLQTGTLNILSYEHESTVLISLNAETFRNDPRR
ncbi:MAG: histidine phosphatase family protein [Proteobacteria bacterium]|jgi:probable phosphoglycerate mutase|nr:histidine phosphatase family protein [Pseudomonadota bacterium]